MYVYHSERSCIRNSMKIHIYRIGMCTAGYVCATTSYIVASVGVAPGRMPREPTAMNPTPETNEPVYHEWPSDWPQGRLYDRPITAEAVFCTHTFRSVWISAGCFAKWIHQTSLAWGQNGGNVMDTGTEWVCAIPKLQVTHTFYNTYM